MAKTKRRAIASKGHFALTRRFGGKVYSVYALKDYDTRRDAEKSASNLRSQGYMVRVVSWGKKYLIYIRRKR